LNGANVISPDTIYRIAKGDLTLFKEIVSKHKNAAYSLCLKILKNPSEAEDALQESFIKLYGALISGKFEQKSKFSTYFYSIVYNTSIDLYRKYYSKNFNLISIDVTESNYKDGDELVRGFNITELRTESMDKSLRSNELSAIIREYLTSLPEQYSVILNLFYVNELSLNEISELLKLPEGTVKNRIFRAKAKLKEMILKSYKEEELLEYLIPEN